MAKLSLCTIIPRKSGAFEREITAVNDFLISFSKRNHSVSLANLSMLKKNMFSDEKHVDKEGLKFLVCAVKFSLLGIFPVIYTARPNTWTDRRHYKSGRNNNRH